MARSFTSGNQIDLGNVYAFDKDTAWSFGIFARFTDFSTGPSVMGKWSSSSGSRQLRIEMTTGGVVEVSMGNGLRITGGTLSTNTDYFIGLTNAGTGAASSLKLYVINLNGTIVDNATAGTPVDTTNQGTSVLIGNRASGTAMEGKLEHAFMVESELILSDFQQIRKHPAKHIRRLQAQAGGSSQFYLPIIGTNNPEQDWSGNNNTGTVTGATSADGFPVKQGYGGSVLFPSITGAADTTAPVLSSPTGTKTGSTTADGTVSTDEGNGTLYYYASTNSSETAATIVASGSSQAVSASGTQNVSFTGLTASTTYYAHYVHDDAATNRSNVVSSTSFTTDAADTTAPVLSSPTGTQTGNTTADGTVSTDEGNGTLYYYASTNSSETAGTIVASGSSQAVSGTGVQNVSFTGLSPSTTYYAHYVHDDAATNRSNVVSSTSFTTTATRSITNIDGDNSVEAGQTNVNIATVGLDAAPTTQIANLIQGTTASAAMTVNTWAATNVNVDIPLHINLDWGATNYAVELTDDTGTVTGSSNVTLAKPAAWTEIVFNGVAPSASTTESYYEYAITDATLSTTGGVTMATTGNDKLAYVTTTTTMDDALTVDVQTIPVIDPAQSVTGSYKIWQDSGNTWSDVSTFAITDGGDFDGTAPVLSSPTGTETGDTTASGTVTTDEANGTLYYYASTNSSESAATIKASGSSQSVVGSGVQNVSVTGLTAATIYYFHYVQDDSATNESNVVSSASFTTDATPDTTAPILSLPTGAQNGDTAADGTVTTDEGNGTLYFYVSTNASETAATIKASGDSQAVVATGSQNVVKTGLTPETTYYFHYVHDDVSLNESNVVSSTSFTTNATVVSPDVPAASQQLMDDFKTATGDTTFSFNQAGIRYYKQVSGSASKQFNETLKAAQTSLPFNGLGPSDRRN